ncbi:hypothetical protein CHUAL_014086 [Chamberlinius hualienensis]
MIELLIETLTGSKLLLKVSPIDTIISVKSKIQRMEGIPVSQQHLVFRSQELADDSTLEDNKITEGATLKLVIAMRGGPINTRRVPLEDSTWKEITDYMEANRGEILEKFPGGRHVTLLLYRDGDQINYFRVLDRGDGTVAPVTDAVGKLEVAVESETVEQQRIRENITTMKKMKSIRKDMEALNLKKPKQTTAEGMSASSSLSSETTIVQPKKSQLSQTVLNRQLKLTSVTTFRPSLVARPPIRPSNSFHQMGQGERQRGRGKSVIRVFRRKPNGIQHEEQGHHPPRENLAVDSNPIMRLTNNGGGGGSSDVRDRSELSNVKPASQLSNDMVRVDAIYVDKNVAKEGELSDGKCTGGAILVDSGNDSFLTNSKRNTGVSVRTLSNDLSSSFDSQSRHVIRNSQMSRIQTDVDHIEQLQETLARFDPRIPSVQPAARSRHPSTINNRTILESMGMGFLSFPSGPNLIGVDIATAPKTSVEISEYNNASGSTSHATGLIAATKLKALPTTFVRNEKEPGNSESQIQAETNDVLTQPLNVKIDEDLSDITRVVQLPSIKTINKHRKERCQVCHHKLGLANSYVCRCGRNFCATHRYAETHDCTYDYKAEGRRILEKNNPQVTAPKLPKI